MMVNVPHRSDANGSQSQVQHAQQRYNQGAAGDEAEYGMTPAQIGILQLNNLTFKLEPDLAVVIQRNVQSSFFLTQSYAPGATMTAVVNSGSAFVNLRQSYIVMDIKNTSSGGTISPVSSAWFGLNGGSAANFINRIQIIAKNGVVLERIDNANQLTACKVNMQYNSSWVKSVGSAMGIVRAVNGEPAASATLGWFNGDTQRFVIPLYAISTLCDSMGTLCPSQLLSGARFEILLESAANSMIDAVNTDKVLSYEVSSCRLEFESYLLTDSVMKVINQTAATEGLEVISATTSDTQAQRTSSMISVDVAKSCSRALSVIYKERAPKGVASAQNGYGTGSAFDPVASAAIVNAAGSGTLYTNLPMEWQVRAGQLYFPQSSLRGSGTAPGQLDTELFIQTLRAFQKLYPGSSGHLGGCDTTVQEFRGRLGVGSGYAGSRACFAVDLQRSSILTSGIPLSNSHQLTIQYSSATPTYVVGYAFNYLVDVYLTYQVCIRTFLSQVVLEV